MKICDRKWCWIQLTRLESWFPVPSSRSMSTSSTKHRDDGQKLCATVVPSTKFCQWSYLITSLKIVNEVFGQSTKIVFFFQLHRWFSIRLMELSMKLYFYSTSLKFQNDMWRPLTHFKATKAKKECLWLDSNLRSSGLAGTSALDHSANWFLNKMYIFSLFECQDCRTQVNQD